MRKKKDYPLNSWVGYLNFLKKSLDRDLTICEIKLAMNRYIHGIKPEELLEELK